MSGNQGNIEFLLGVALKSKFLELCMYSYTALGMGGTIIGIGTCGAIAVVSVLVTSLDVCLFNDIGTANGTGTGICIGMGIGTGTGTCIKTSL